MLEVQHGVFEALLAQTPIWQNRLEFFCSFPQLELTFALHKTNTWFMCTHTCTRTRALSAEVDSVLRSGRKRVQGAAPCSLVVFSGRVLLHGEFFCVFSPVLRAVLLVFAGELRGMATCLNLQRDVSSLKAWKTGGGGGPNFRFFKPTSLRCDGTRQELDVYSKEKLQEYLGAQSVMDLPPHIYALGRHADQGLQQNRRSQAGVGLTFWRLGSSIFENRALKGVGTLQFYQVCILLVDGCGLEGRRVSFG